MGLESAASRSLVSSSSPTAGAISDSSLGFFVVFVRALSLDFEVGPSKDSENAAATSFKAVVRDFCDLGAALELRLERVMMLAGNHQPVLFLKMLLTCLRAWPFSWLIAAIFGRTSVINHERWTRVQFTLSAALESAPRFFFSTISTSISDSTSVSPGPADSANTLALPLQLAGVKATGV
jgi:hypothetical protein